MVYKTIEFKKSAKLRVVGDSEKITLELLRGSTVKDHQTIHLHPGFLELVFPAYNNESLTALRFSEEAKEELFRSRIQRGIKVMSEFAWEYVREDEKEERRIMTKQKADEQKRMDLDQFIESIVPVGND